MDVERFREVYLKRINPVLDQSRSKTNIPQLMEVKICLLIAQPLYNKRMTVLFRDKTMDSKSKYIPNIVKKKNKVN